MKIWLDQVREEPFSWEETESIPPETLDRPELLAMGPVTWRGEVVFADPGYLLRGKLSYEQTLACIRCLKPHVETADAEVDLMLVVEEHPRHPARARRTEGAEAGSKGPKPDRLEAVEHEILESDLNTQTVEGDVFDTWPLVLEQLQLNIPMKPLCRPDCPGLCPRCGADLDAGACSCAEPAADPRWAALLALKSKLGEGGTGGVPS
jgi:uncharacterized protein